MTKPLKTVEEWFEAYMPKGTVKPNKKIDAEKAELMTLIMANWRKRAKADLYQLMLSLKPEEKEGVKEYRDSDGEAYLTCKTCGGYDECDCDGYNEALADWEAKLSEHFNGEGV